MDDYVCPTCQWSPFDAYDGEPYEIEGTRYPIITDRSYNLAAAINYGGNPYDWTENHHCEECGTDFSFRNANY